MMKNNTIYIISKGRPQCKTAQTFTKLKYPGEWFIVCGSNDESLIEYKRLWGDKILVFDYDEQIKQTDTLDNFGFESKASGACPVRNAVRSISKSRGETRHWQFDDDYNSFYLFDKKKRTNRIIRDGAVLYKVICDLSDFAEKANLCNLGFSLSGPDSMPDSISHVAMRVFNAHNQSNNDFVEWKGRLNDDLIHSFFVLKERPQMAVRFLQLKLAPTQSEAGGLTDMYKADGTVRKTAYAIMVQPNACRLVVKYGRYHHNVNWKFVCPKIINERFKR